MLTISEVAQIAFFIIFICTVFFGLLAYFLLRRAIVKRNQELEERKARLNRKIKVEDKLEKIQKNLQEKLFVPQELQSDGVMPASSAFFGVVKLEAYVREINPKFLVGINRGGWLLSTYLAHRLEIERPNILRYDSNVNKIVDVHKPLTTKNTRILLIDDISRTGDSIAKGLSYIQELFPLCKLSVAVLVVCGKNKNNPDINFSSYYTNTVDIQLPWSPEDRKQKARKRLAKSGQKALLVGTSKDSLTEESNILRLSLDEPNHEVKDVIDIANNDVDVVVELFQNLLIDREAQ